MVAMSSSSLGNGGQARSDLSRDARDQRRGRKAAVRDLHLEPGVERVEEFQETEEKDGHPEKEPQPV